MTDDYETGFGKPPKSGQWKKGQSGNPNGRPKQKVDYLSNFVHILSEQVKARQPDGRMVTLGGLEAAYVQLCKKALKGDNAALFQAIRFMLDILPNGQKAEEQIASECAGAKERFMKLAGWTGDDQISD